MIQFCLQEVPEHIKREVNQGGFVWAQPDSYIRQEHVPRHEHWGWMKERINDSWKQKWTSVTVVASSCLKLLKCGVKNSAVLLRSKMNRNPRNDKKDNKQNVHGCRKITNLETYDVKRFPYPGKRKSTPAVYQSEDGGIIISNDVFGLTIKQFERVYQGCLDRRKTQEQYILNLRYPDKTSNGYLEYLQDSTDYDKDYVTWTGNNLKGRNLYELLVNINGTERDIRTRQQLFITEDMISSVGNVGSKITKISSGSLSEGLDLPGSDIDVMYVIEYLDIIRSETDIKHTVQQTTMVMETDNKYPGFTHLRLVAVGDENCFVKLQEFFESTGKGLYFSVNKFVGQIYKNVSHDTFSLHGPCLSDKNQYIDFAICLRSQHLPYIVIPWATRCRLQWPPNSVIDKITNNGCLLVPIGPRDLPDCTVLWRLSFSVAEKLLVHSFNYSQLLCYCLLKLTLKHIVNENQQSRDLLCSYFLKTAIFWVSEETDIDTFQVSKLYTCFSLCLSKLIVWVNNCYCPNYFIPEQNMFIGKISSDNNKKLIHVLDYIKCAGIDALIQIFYQPDYKHHRLLRTQRETSIIMLDLLFYRISHSNFGFLSDISKCLKTLRFTEKMIKSKSSAFIVDVCTFHHAEISQYAAQLLPTPTVTTESYTIHKRYHRHLQDGIKTDAVSGWLLYTSFYYVSGQFNITLRLTDHVLSKCVPDMLLVGCTSQYDREINYYRNNVHSTMKLQDKMRMAVVNTVKYVNRSSFIPKELQFEVKTKCKCIPHTVMSYCLRFLCYHHIGDILNRQHALRDLYLTVKRRNFIAEDTLSHSRTILGVCYEISGDKDSAYQCYTEALTCDGGICATAEARRSKLLTDLV
ncbi:uncharacterized protein [Mytilus edulis]|uniref:uncharacterized protein n=1 Tax=Mytilus edulis TaxID=6550 RepID=UPI0039EFDCC6